jgi:hypothetical protein
MTTLCKWSVGMESHLKLQKDGLKDALVHYLFKKHGLDREMSEID